LPSMMMATCRGARFGSKSAGVSGAGEPAGACLGAGSSS